MGLPLPYDIDVDQGIVKFESDHLLSIEDFRARLDAIAVDPRYRRGFHFLSDLTHLREVPSTEYVHQAIAVLMEMADVLGPFRYGFVTGSTATYGMGRMAEVLVSRSKVTIRAFRDREQALRWVRTGEEPV